MVDIDLKALTFAFKLFHEVMTLQPNKSLLAGIFTGWPSINELFETALTFSKDCRFNIYISCSKRVK